MGGGQTEKEKEEKEEEEKIPHTCESIGHRPLWGRCPKMTSPPPLIGAFINLLILGTQRNTEYDSNRLKNPEMVLKTQAGLKNTMNQSPKGNMWSAIPIALLCMFVNVGDG